MCQLWFLDTQRGFDPGKGKGINPVVFPHGGMNNKSVLIHVCRQSGVTQIAPRNLTPHYRVSQPRVRVLSLCLCALFGFFKKFH